MRFMYGQLCEIVVAITTNAPSDREVSGYVKANGDFRIFQYNDDSAGFVNEKVSFHTHTRRDSFSLQDAIALVLAKRTQVHILVAPKKVFVFKREKQVSERHLDCLVTSAGIRSKEPSIEVIGTYLKSAGFRVSEFSRGEFPNG